MNKNKRTKFVEAITPVIHALNEEWHPPDTKIIHTDGKEYYLACRHCDLNCSRHDKHDDDCIVQLGKNLKEYWDEVDATDNFNLGYNGETGKWDRQRTPEEIKEMKDWKKYMSFFEKFLKQTSYDMMVPVDYQDPNNNNIICSCWMYWHRDEDADRRQHWPKCPTFLIASALSDLYRPN
jgi:hypothetical protein